jgi:hypothetical protein
MQGLCLLVSAQDLILMPHHLSGFLRSSSFGAPFFLALRKLAQKIDETFHDP